MNKKFLKELKREYMWFCFDRDFDNIFQLKTNNKFIKCYLIFRI